MISTLVSVMSRLNVSCMLWYVVGQNAKAAVLRVSIQLCRYTKQQLVCMLNMHRRLGMSVKEVKLKEQERRHENVVTARACPVIHHLAHLM